MSQQLTANLYGGTADYLLPGEPHPAWLVDACPGARKLRDEWQKRNAEGRELHKAAQPLRETLQQLRQDVQRNLATKTELEAAENEMKRADVEIAQASRRAKSALHAYNEHMYAMDADLRIRVSARRALDFHTDAVEALAAFKEAYKGMEEAWQIAGRPGRDPKNNQGAHSNHFDGGYAPALRTLEALTKLDMPALEKAAEGEEFKTQAQMDAEIQELQRKNWVKTAAASLRR